MNLSIHNVLKRVLASALFLLTLAPVLKAQHPVITAHDLYENYEGMSRVDADLTAKAIEVARIDHDPEAMVDVVASLIRYKQKEPHAYGSLGTLADEAAIISLHTGNLAAAQRLLALCNLDPRLKAKAQVIENDIYDGYIASSTK